MAGLSSWKSGFHGAGMAEGVKRALMGALTGLCVGTMLALSPAAQAETLPVHVGVIPVIGGAPFFVANGEGWLRDAQLDVTVKTFDSGPNIVQAAVSGGIDVYVAGIAPLAVARAKGIDFRVVAAEAIDENVLVSGAKLHAYFKAGVKAAEALKQFRDEQGRPAKFATQPPGSVPYANLLYWLREVNKVDPADFQIVPVGIDATQQAILAGAVDAATVREPTLTIIQKRNPQIALLASGEELFPGQPGTVVAVHGPFFDKHPEAVKALVTAIIRAIDTLKTNPDKALPHIEAALSKGLVDTATLRKALGSPAVHFVGDPAAIKASTKALLEYQIKLGSLNKAPPVDELINTDVYANALKDAASR